jgi:hypothetical protein
MSVMALDYTFVQFFEISPICPDLLQYHALNAKKESIEKN